MRISDWSSDVCSSDLLGAFVYLPAVRHQRDVRAFAADLGDAQRNPVVLERHVALDATQQLDRFQMDHWIVIENRSEEHTSELQSLMRISYAVFCLKKKTNKYTKI